MPKFWGNYLHTYNMINIDIICSYVYNIYIYIYIYTCVYAYICMHTCIHTYIHILYVLTCASINLMCDMHVFKYITTYCILVHAILGHLATSADS